LNINPGFKTVPFECNLRRYTAEEEDDDGVHEMEGSRVKHPKMLVARPKMLVVAGKENDSGIGRLNRATAANNRRITLGDFYAGDSNGAAVKAEMSPTTTKKAGAGAKKKSADVVSSVNDAHRTARLAMRQQEKVFAKAATKKALSDEAVAADAAKVAADAARVAANKRFAGGSLSSSSSHGGAVQVESS
jgi:hypothetical protein